MAVVMRGREPELAVLLDAVARARAGEGNAVVVVGEPGMGTSTMLDAVAPEDFLVFRTCGVAPESGIPLAGLHRLLQPLAGRISPLPGSHAQVLEPVITGGLAPNADAFALCTAVHRLLVSVAGDGPVLCLADDVRLMDRRSVAALGFAARRLTGAPVLMMFGSVSPASALAGIPLLALGRLGPVAARELLADRVPLGMPDDLAEELIDLGCGNPLALVELAGALTAGQLSGEAPAPSALPPDSRLRAWHLRAFAGLSPAARRLVMLSAVDDRLEVDTLVRAGIELEALEEAQLAGLLRVDGERVAVPSPLIRSTLCADAPVAERQAAHRLLVRVLDPEQHRLRWTWQRVAAGIGPRRRLADELVDAADAAYTLGDAGRAQELATRAVGIARGHGLLALLPWAFVYVSMGAMLHDRHVTALSSSLEGMRIAAAMGQQNCVVDHLTILALLAGLLGDRETALVRLAAATEAAGNRGLGRPSALSSWAVACADLADDRPADAMDRLRLMAAGTGYLHPAIRAMAAPHFVEAAARCGERSAAVAALAVFDHWARTTGSIPRLAQSHRCHALLADAEADADEHFREAIRLHRASNTALELAKTELFYAHQLRRSRKPRAAREHLRDALKIFQQYDAELWARRARAELRAAGDPVSPPGGHPVHELTPQQEEIARLVGAGATNREIAAQLVISPRTVDHHLRNIFARLGVRSRVELAALLR